MGAGKSTLEVMSDLITSTSGPAPTPTYVRSTVETECAMFVSLGHNQMGFATWHDECFVPNKLNPAVAKAELLRTEKFKRMELDAFNQFTRQYRPAADSQHLANVQQQLLGAEQQLAALQEHMRAHQQAPPATGEGDIEAQPLTHMEQLGLQMQAATAIVEAARAALQDQQPSAFVLHPGQLQLMNEIADTVLLTDEDKLQMLLKYVSEDNDQKQSILEDMNARRLAMTAKEKYKYFVERMSEGSSTYALEIAMWEGIQRTSLLEQPMTFATRFKRAAKYCGRPRKTINKTFMDKVVLPWHNDSRLKKYIANFEVYFAEEVDDNVALHIDDIAKKAFAWERLAYNQAVDTLQAAGMLVPEEERQSRQEALRETATPASSEGASKAKQSLAAKLDLPMKKMASGRSYSACAKCFVMTGKHEWHALTQCPFHKFSGNSGKQGVGGGQTLLAGSRAQQEFVCFRCGRPGHKSAECKATEQTEAGKTAWRDFKERKERRVRDRSEGHQANFAQGNSSQDTVQDATLQVLTALSGKFEQVIAALSSSASGAPKGGSAQQDSTSGTNFMAQAATYDAWLPQTIPEGGFALDDGYDSERDGASMLVAAPGFTPLGMIPAVLTGEKRRGRPPKTPRAATAVPQSTRRQQRMYHQDHDEERAMRNKLPVGMTNPTDLPDSAQPAADLPGHMDHHRTVSMREAQLVSLARTCLKHTKFGNLSAELVTDRSPEATAAWQRAKHSALAGELHDGQDPRSVAWQAAVDKATTLWAAQAQLSLRDYLHIDMRQVFKAAIRIEFGEAAVASATEHLLSANVLDAPPQLPASFVSDAVLSPTPVPSKLEQRRMAIRKHTDEKVRWNGRRPVAILDGRRYNLCLNGQPLGLVVLDHGANEPMIHQRLITSLGIPTSEQGRSITGINGVAAVMPKTIDNMEIRLFYGDAEREVSAIDRMTVMSGDSLPDALLDNEMLAMLGITVDGVSWTASFPVHPWDLDSDYITMELYRPQPRQHSALAAETPARAAAMPVEAATGTIVDGSTTFQGFCCMAAAAMPLPVPGFARRQIPVVSDSEDEDDYSRLIETPNSAPYSSQVGGGHYTTSGHENFSRTAWTVHA